MADEKKKLTDEEWREQQRTYSAYIHSKMWRAIRKAKIASVGKACEECGETRLTLHVHHLHYGRFGGQERPEDLQVLCKPCHEWAHKVKKNPRLQKKIAKKRRQKVKVEAKQKAKARSQRIPKAWLPPGGLTWSWKARQEENETPARVVWSRSKTPELPKELDPAMRPRRRAMGEKHG